jgi:WD40 repeat protein
MLATRNDSTNTTTIWDWRTEEQVIQIPGFAVAFSKDSSRVAIGNSNSGTTAIWNVNPWRQETAFEGSLPAFGDDRNVLAIGSELNGNTRVWNIDERTYQIELPGTSPVFSPNGNRLATVDNIAGNTMIWNTATWKPDGEFSGFIPVFGGDDNLLALGDYQLGTTSIWDLRTRESQLVLPGFLPAFGAEDNVLAVGHFTTNITTTWDLNNDASIKWLATGTSAVFARNGEILASQSSDGIVLRDFSSNQILKRLNAEALTGTNVMAFFANDKGFAAVNSQGSLLTWDIASGDLTISGEVGQFGTSPTFSPDGNYLIYAGERSLEVWDVASGEPYRVAGSLEIPNDWNDISFSPDGNLMSLAVGNTVSLYDFPRLTSLGGEFPTGAVISDLGFVMEDANLKYLITFYASGGTQIWDWANRTKIADPMSGNLRFVGSNTEDRSVIYIDPSDRLIRFKWGLNQESWKKILCPLARRNFTKAEWDFYFPGQEPPSVNELTCVQYPGWQEAATKP